MSKAHTKIGRGNSLFYALIVGAFLTWNTVSWSYSKEEGWQFKSKDVPLAIVTPCLVLMGVALGINLGGAFKAITELAMIVSRNSIAINTLANQQIVNPTSEVDTESDTQTQSDEQK